MLNNEKKYLKIIVLSSVLSILLINLTFGAASDSKEHMSSSVGSGRHQTFREDKRSSDSGRRRTKRSGDDLGELPGAKRSKKHSRKIAEDHMVKAIGQAREYMDANKGDVNKALLSAIMRHADVSVLRALVDVFKADVNHFFELWNPRMPLASSESTPLITALKNGTDAAVLGLVSMGADVNISQETRSPLQTALIFMRSLDIVRLLLDAGADIESKNREGDTPLNAASIMQSDLAIVNELIDRKANVKAVGNYGNTPLHYAVQRVDFADIEVLANIIRRLIYEGADVNALNLLGKTPMDLIPVGPNSDVIYQLLYDAGGAKADELGG
jgi:hypothetical protein